MSSINYLSGYRVIHY